MKKGEKEITFDKEDLRRIKDKDLGNKLWDMYKNHEAKDIISPEENKIKLQYAYQFIISALTEYLDLKEEYYNIIALWIIGTYSHKEFPSYPYLFFNAMRGSGKSRALKIITYAAKDGAMLNSLTEAVLFRENGTLCIDEFEGLGRKGTENLKELLNSAYKKGTFVKRMRKAKTIDGEEQVVEKFDVYRPIVMANIYGLVDEALKDRCITLILEKSNIREKINLIELFETDENLNNAKEILNQCRLCRSVSLAEVYKGWNFFVKDNGTNNTNYTNYTNSTNITQLFKSINSTTLNGREIELTLPLFIVADEVGVLSKTITALEEIFKERREDDKNDNFDISLYEMFSMEPENSNWIGIKEIVTKFKEFTGNNDEWINTKWMGRALKRLNLVLQKKKIASGRYVLIDYKKAREKMLIFS